MRNVSVPFRAVSYRDLRDRHVMSVFGEKAVFRNRHVVSWHAGQSVSERPDLVIWERYITQHELGRACVAQEAKILMTLADQYSFRDGNPLVWKNTSEEVREMCAQLDPYAVGVFKAPNSRPIMLLRHYKPEIATEYRSYIGRGPTDPTVRVNDIARVLVECWASGSRRAQLARAFMCEQLKVKIDSVQEQSVTNFDEAVATTGDGSDIQPAAWVVLYPREADGKCQIFPAGYFRDHKLSLLPEHERREENVPGTIPELLGRADRGQGSLRHLANFFAGYPKTGQGVVQTVEDGQLLFFCRSDLMKTPLPDGGIDVP